MKSAVVALVRHKTDFSLELEADQSIIIQAPGQFANYGSHAANMWTGCWERERITGSLAADQGNANCTETLNIMIKEKKNNANPDWDIACDTSGY